MSIITAVLLGFIVGLLANWGYGVIMRLLPATLCRYPVKIDIAKVDKSLSGMLAITVSIKIGPPGISRALMEPLAEDLEAKLKIDGKEWVNGVWRCGDVDEDYFTANRTTRSYVVLAETGSNGMPVFLFNKYGEDKFLMQDRKHLLEVQIIRVIDNKVGDSKVFRIEITESKFSSIGGI